MYTYMLTYYKYAYIANSIKYQNIRNICQSFRCV